MISSRDPKKPAIICGTETVSFAELAERVAAETPDGFVLNATTTMGFIVQFLSYLRASKPVALFSPAWSVPETAARAKLVIDHRKIDHQTAVILFTSGSTGAPKAVQLSRANIDANTRAVLSTLDFDKASEQTLFLPLSYSFGLLGQLLPALECGMTTRLFGRFSDVKALFDDGTASGMWSGVPSHWEALLRLTDSAPKACDRITHVISAGAPMSVELRRRLRERFTKATLYNNYGQTEASPRVLSFSSRHPEFFDGPVGFPVGDFQARLTDAGELCVKGSQVMLGYLGDTAATDEKIRDGWLHTGDAARLAPGGLVSILGRADELFNIGGERTSPLEIETALKSLQGVRDAAVLIEDDPLYGSKISAFLVCSLEDDRYAKKALAQELAAKLSQLKIPRDFFTVDALPRTENGKLVRAKLAEARVAARKIK